MLLTALAMASIFGAACGGDDSATDAGTDADSAMDAAPDACVPLTCADISTGCGMHPNGCGTVLDCGTTCGCTVPDDCPSRPCEAATCEASMCVYGAVSCGGDTCECAGACDDDDLRSCGTCGAEVCDPSPQAAGGVVTYANVCAPAPTSVCGTCDLGAFGCNGSGDLVCDDISVPLLARVELAECDSTLPESSFVFVDPAFTIPGGEAPDGSRGRPFATLATGIAAVRLSSAFAVVIGGSPTFMGTFAVVDGVTVHGGYSPAPEFTKVDAEWPTIQAGPADAADDRVVALTAIDLVLRTRVEHLRLVTEPLTDANGDTAAGAFIGNSPGFEIADMRIEIGDAAPGAAGVLRGAQAAGGAAAGMGPNGFPTRDCSSSASGGTGGTLTCDGRSLTDGRGGTGARTGAGLPLDTPDYLSGSGEVFYIEGQESFGRAAGGETTQVGGGITPFMLVVGDGANGRTGLDGGARTAARVSVALSPTDGFPVPTGVGAGGGAGQPGVGGGGGSSGMIRRDASWCAAGGAGGGGGAGGCGGRGGGGGYPGGWAIGVVVAGGIGSLVLEDLTITLGSGGTGGPGGPGAPGAAGDPGAAGGYVTGDGYTSTWWHGGTGGTGGTGGMGGPGGTGAAGYSVGVFTDGPYPGGDLSAAGITVGSSDRDLCDDGNCCTAAETLCGGSCTDVSTSFSHCGACGNDCDTAVDCVAGMCVF